MKAAFGAEAIGLGYEADTTKLMAPIMAAAGVDPELRRLLDQAGISEQWTGRRARNPQHPRPWVAELMGLHPHYRFERRFLSHRTDYRQASSTGNRGVWFWWTLESGHVYEASYRTSWGSGFTRRFLTVAAEGDIVDMTAEEVRAWLNAGSASTS